MTIIKKVIKTPFNSSYKMLGLQSKGVKNCDQMVPHTKFEILKCTIY